MGRSQGRILKVDTIIVSKGNKLSPLSSPMCKVPGIKESDLKGGYKAIPLAGQKSYFGVMNDYAFSFTKQYLQAHNKTFNAVQERGEKSFPVMEKELEKHNIPKELEYLAVIESALNNQAVSHAGAVGPWQLMSSTARLMGLNVSRKHDERKDWNRSTNAAAKYLSILYNQMNDWLLVIAAYNSGPAPVQRAIDRTGSHNFWDIKPYLPRETQGHVLAFIATASIFENLSNFIGLGEIPDDLKLDKNGKPIAETEEKLAEKKNMQPKSPFTMEELQKMSIVSITEPLSMELLAQELSIDLKLLNKWNPDYQLFVYNTYPTKDYKLRIPKDKLDNFVQKKEHLEKRSKQIFSEMTM
jgi:membrane-bound lytic murein transglycosylase D